MNEKFSDKIFYHIYPLGMAGCPKQNDFCQSAGNVFEKLTGDLDRIKFLGVNAILIGPVFESTAHGYDTVDYFYVDRRLGNNQKFADFCNACHEKGISIILDAVFNHTGRNFFAFRDLQQNGENSKYKCWYKNLNFNQRSNYGDCFDYDGWAGCKDLVKLDTDNPEVQEYFFSAVKHWIDEFKIDGLRLDAADVLSKDFMDNLNTFCNQQKNDFFLMGEVVHGDYNDWARYGRLDSVTNYQLYKAMWSALNEQNMFELAYNANREFGNKNSGGIYKNLQLYNFVDNHDVNRIASVLNDSKHLHLIYGMLFTLPGIPSVYYWSENGIKGARGAYDDYDLRPAVPPFVNEVKENLKPFVDMKALCETIQKFAGIRKSYVALQKGDYNEIAVTNTSFAFSRQWNNEKLIVCINSALNPQKIKLNLSGKNRYEDILNGGTFTGTQINNLEVPACWLRIYMEK